MNTNNGAFRFAYFTKKYAETCEFYENQLEFIRDYFWDRNEDDKGSLFKAGLGLIEILKFPTDKSLFNLGLDYREPQGVFMVIQVPAIDEIFEKYKAKGLHFKQEITNQSWGHRSFSIIEPNGLILMFVQDIIFKGNI
jgi:uncharacterized glyoxalase superfamily protein PhnB